MKFDESAVDRSSDLVSSRSTLGQSKGKWFSTGFLMTFKSVLEELTALTRSFSSTCAIKA